MNTRTFPFYLIFCMFLGTSASGEGYLLHRLTSKSDPTTLSVIDTSKILESVPLIFSQRSRSNRKPSRKKPPKASSESKTSPSNESNPSVIPKPLPSNESNTSVTPKPLPSNESNPSVTPKPLPSNEPKPSSTPKPLPSNEPKPSSTPKPLPSNEPKLLKISESSLIIDKGRWWKNTNSSDRLKGISFAKKDNEYIAYLYDQSGSITVYIYSLILEPSPKNSIIPIDLIPYDARKLVYHSILQLDSLEKPGKLKIVLRKQPLGKKRPDSFASDQEVNFEAADKGDELTK
jgi:hypothetical protein